MVYIFYEDTEILDLDPEFFVSWLSVVVSRETFSLGDVNLVFCSEAFLLEMNQKYLNHDYHTDVITFDYTENDVVSGDLFISIDMVRHNAVFNNCGFIDELRRVVVHGVLHLCGYNDKTLVDQEKMSMKEDECLALIV
ncbi:MAG: rRNA maturation RNase YbeY [Crocinitomicaceae bacterium]|nr:rRNA maturation RNase YbeY [Crocinitomicaceae bacterium]